MSLHHTSLEEAYGKPFGGRVPIRETSSTPGSIVQPEFTTLEKKAETAVKSNESVLKSLLTSGSLPIAESRPRETVAPEVRMATRERFTERPVASAEEDKLTRILRLIEQNKTGYERPAVQDMVLYVFTGVFFLFTLDTFVLLGKSMRKIRKA